MTTARNKVLFAKCDDGLKSAVGSAAASLGIAEAEFIRRAVAAAAGWLEDRQGPDDDDLDAKLDAAFGPLNSL